MMISSGEPPLSIMSGAAGALPATGPSFKRAFLGFVGSTSLLSTAMVLLSSL
jgi:hypothetical protein